MLVNSLRAVTLLLILSASMAEVKEGQTEAAPKGWFGIVPLRSTRAEVERLIGPPKSSLGEVYTYNMPDNRVDISYVPDPCKKSGVNSPSTAADVVVKITVTPKKLLLVRDLSLDKNKYRRIQLDHPENWVEYLNAEEGITVEALLNGGREELISTIYRATERERELRCGQGSTPSMTTKDRSSPIVSAPAQRLNQARTREQTIFGAEEEVSRPARVPEAVLQILRQDQRNQTRLAEGQSPDDMPESWFIASEIHLNNDDQPDLVVMAANPRLFGANLVPFWIFRNTPKGHELVLSVSALGLEVLKTRTNRYRNIRTTAATAEKVFTTTYNFDGAKYQQGRSREEPINE